MHFKITAQNRVIAPFQKRVFRDLWRDYVNLNVAVDPNMS